MPISKRVLLIAGAVGLFLLLLIVVIVVVIYQTGGLLPGVIQHCPSNVTKCANKNELFVVESGKCFRKGEDPEGTCGPNMSILPLANCNIQGQCECAYDRHNRTLIYHPETAQCYFIYQQGFCSEGQWVRLRGPRGNGVCEENICLKDNPSNGQQGGELVPFRDKCYFLYSNLDIPGCKGTLRFWKNKLDPSCTEPDKINTGSVGAIPSAVCPQGSFQAINGHCQPEVIVDF